MRPVKGDVRQLGNPSVSLLLCELGNSNNHINKVTACKTRLVSNYQQKISNDDNQSFARLC